MVRVVVEGHTLSCTPTHRPIPTLYDLEQYIAHAEGVASFDALMVIYVWAAH